MNPGVLLTGLSVSRIDAILSDPELSGGLSADELDMLLDTRNRLTGTES